MKPNFFLIVMRIGRYSSDIQVPGRPDRDTVHLTFRVWTPVVGNSRFCYLK